MFLVSKNVFEETTIKAALSHNLTNSFEDNRKKDTITGLDENNMYGFSVVENVYLQLYLWRQRNK